MQPASVLRQCINDVFTQIKDTHEFNEGEVSEDHLVALQTLAGEDAERALLSYEADRVTIFSDEYDRKIFMVKTNPGKYYFVNYYVDACTCQSYKHRVLKAEPETFFCKHIIIVKLAHATGNFNKKSLEQPKLSTILANPPEFDDEKEMTVVRLSNSESIPLEEFLFGKEEPPANEESTTVKSQPSSQVPCVTYTQASQNFQGLMLSQGTK